MSEETAVVTTEPAPVSRDLRLVATNPNQLAVEQTRLIAWCQGKIAGLTSNIAELEENLALATRGKWKVTTLRSAIRREKNRLSYYDKIKAALEAGYFIVPNFDAEVFAVRTTRQNPPMQEGAGGVWNLQAVEPPPAQLGEGRHVPAIPEGHTYETPEKRTRYVADNFAEEIDFPFALAKPQVLTATQGAMALKIFDDLAVLPRFARANNDPMVVGIIRRKEGDTTHRCTFLIAWFLDTETL
jgi:hypothetical protein